MNIHYLHEQGIKLWEHLDLVETECYSTLTLIKGSIAEFRPFWQEFSNNLIRFFPSFLKWKTLGYPFDRKVQEFKFLKKIRSTLNDRDYCKKNELSDIYSFLVFEYKNIFNFDLNEITQSNYTIGVFTKENNLKTREYWEILKECDTGLTAKNILHLLNGIKNTVVLRVKETETHTAMQFFGSNNEIELVLKSLVDFNIIKISEKDVSEIINGKLKKQGFLTRINSE